MSKLTIVSPKEVIRILEKLNFKEVRQSGSHKLFRHKDGRATVISVHTNDLKRGLIKQIIKDIKITDEEYEELRKSK